jgi:C-terminal processing protease CtpA/Prc
VKVLRAIALLLFFSATALAQNSSDYERDFDALWSGLQNGYAYFGKKHTDWHCVRNTYRPQAAAATSKKAFVTVLERTLDELYDPHTHLKTNTGDSTRLIPTGLDVWAEFRDGHAVITALRSGFSAEQAGLRIGMEITAINGTPVAEAISARLGHCLVKVDDDARSWALRALLAGIHSRARIVAARAAKGKVKTFTLDLPTQRRVDDDHSQERVEKRILPSNIGYIRLNDLGSEETVAEFDAALKGLRNTRALILDLRNTPSGGNTSVAEPMMGRFVLKKLAYQKGIPRRGEPWTAEVEPRGPWTYTRPVVVLVGRWTASMGEGIAIGLDGMKRATIVGTPMAGLNGAVFDLKLQETGISMNYAAEKLFHVDGTPREDFIPRVVVKLSPDPKQDAPLKEALRQLQRSKPTKQTN